MHIFRYSLAILVYLLASNQLPAFEVSVEFSADAVQQVPARPEYKARMYVSKSAVRTESVLNSVPVVEIVNTKEMTRMMLVPKEKIYLIQQGNKQSSWQVNKPDSKNPCKGLPDTTCKMLGKEKINNRQTEKWEFSITRNGQKYRSLHWIDAERRMPVREFFPDGTVTELSITGNEKINGRNAEKWSMQMTRADGQKMTSLQWYDPELKITIREEMDGGFVRELRNIKVGKQEGKLFAIPGDYKKVDQLPGYLMPQPPANQTRH